MSMDADNYYADPGMGFRLHMPAEGYFLANGFTYTILSYTSDGTYGSTDDDMESKSYIKIEKFNELTVSGTFYFEDSAQLIVAEGEFRDIPVEPATGNPGIAFYKYDGLPDLNSYAFANILGSDSSHFNITAGHLDIREIPLTTGTWDIPDTSTAGIWSALYSEVYAPSYITVESVDPLGRSVTLSFEIYYIMNSEYHELKECYARAYY